MKKIYFKCELLTDVILNQKAATEGNQETLDFIPGNNFLGIAAGKLYKEMNNETWELFHSGKVRFGDAHPTVLNEKGESFRSLRIPASMYYPKLKKVTESCYIHHFYNREEDIDKQQLKQCRYGFYAFNETENKAYPANIEKTFAIKSAYDRDMRRSANEQMYGYQSLQAGSKWRFEVIVDNENRVEQIRKSLEGERHIGRSRSAQYGLIDIQFVKDEEILISEKDIETNDDIIIYADGRLIFLDDFGIPTFQPDAEKHFKIEGGEIDWKKSQIRTFQYAPWNYQRQVRDADRCGIEKGSVFVVKKRKEAEKLSYKEQPVVGVFQNEGFGAIIYNPFFLKKKENSNGKALFTILEKVYEQPDKPIEITEETKESVEYRYLERCKKQEKDDIEVYKLVNKFVKNYTRLFKDRDARFASQWGNIRTLATQFSDDMAKRHQEIRIYLTKGVAKDKWEERNRFKIFNDEFLKKIESQFDNKNAQLALINLAAEMAKEQRRS